METGFLLARTGMTNAASFKQTTGFTRKAVKVWFGPHRGLCQVLLTFLPPTCFSPATLLPERGKNATEKVEQQKSYSRVCVCCLKYYLNVILKDLNLASFLKTVKNGNYNVLSQEMITFLVISGALKYNCDKKCFGFLSLSLLNLLQSDLVQALCS